MNNKPIANIRIYQDKLDAYWLELVDDFGFKQDMAITLPELRKLFDTLGVFFKDYSTLTTQKEKYE